ncbi:EscU/YscU/HrcU family type III secretion system export apparatus switch protein, partial [Acinetobacter baumannii]
VGLVAGMVVISLLLPPALEHMKQAFAGFLETAWARPVDAGGVGDLLRAMLFDVLKTLALIFATLLVTAYLPGAIQTGFLFTTEPLKPNLE